MKHQMKITKKNSNNTIIITDQNGKNFNNDTDLANYCNKHYCEIGAKMANLINTPTNKTEILYPNITNSMYLRPVTNNELSFQIASLRNNGYCPDKISTKLIKKCHNYLIPPLTHIINLIFETGEVPSKFKTSVVTPVFETGNKNFIINYRPISQISPFA